MSAPPAAGNLADRIRQHWGRAGEELPLERLVAELGDSSRYDIVAALKELEKAGAGALSVGRKGQRANFVWAQGVARAAAVTERRVAPPKRAGKAAARTLLAQAQGGDAAARPPSGPPLLEHSFHVRPQVVATFHLPEDVTRTEIERLCLLLQAIPFR